MSKTARLSIRLNLEKDADRQAWEYLQHIPHDEHKSMNRAVISAINEHFDRQERMLHDSYLETREKEDAFLQKVLDAITQGVTAAAPINALGGLMPLLQRAQSPLPAPADDDNMDAALDFVNSL